MSFQEEIQGPVRRTGLLEKVAAIAKGLFVTAQEALTGQRVTQQYPEEHYVPYPRFRGRHILRRHENGLERCVGCSLCAAACPAHCIRVIAAENTPEHRVSEGDRYAVVYEINMLRCIFCGYCVEACPTEALGMSGEYELASYTRDAQIYGKERLLEPMPAQPSTLIKDDDLGAGSSARDEGSRPRRAPGNLVRQQSDRRE